MVVEGRIGHDKHPGTFENFRFLYTWLYSIKHQVSLAPVWTWTALLPCVLGGGTPLLLIITTLSIYTECGEMWLWSRTAAADGVLRAISCPLPLQVRCCGGERGGGRDDGTIGTIITDYTASPVQRRSCHLVISEGQSSVFTSPSPAS